MNKMTNRLLNNIALNGTVFGLIYVGYALGVDEVKAGVQGVCWFISIISIISLFVGNISGSAPAPEWYKRFDFFVDLIYIFIWFALGNIALAVAWAFVLIASQAAMHTEDSE